MTTEKVVRAFKANFPDYYSMILPDGTRFSFTNQVIKTDKTKIIEEILRLIEAGREIEEISPDQAEAAEVKTAPSRVPKDVGKSATISPADLESRLAAVRNPAQGITSTKSMEGIAAESISKSK